MPLVIDSSAVIALAMADEDASYAEGVLRELAAQPAFAPMLFWHEVRIVLIVNERRGRITATETGDFLRELATLPISLDWRPVEAEVLRLARRHGLSVYDAGYLELTLRHHATLATLDQKLKDAAFAERSGVFEP